MTLCTQLVNMLTMYSFALTHVPGVHELIFVSTLIWGAHEVLKAISGGFEPKVCTHGSL